MKQIRMPKSYGNLLIGFLILLVFGTATISNEVAIAAEGMGDTHSFGGDLYVEPKHLVDKLLVNSKEELVSHEQKGEMKVTEMTQEGIEPLTNFEPSDENTKYVSTWFDFVLQYFNPNVNKIILMNDLTVNDSVPDTGIQRDLVIDGAGHTITYDKTNRDESLGLGEVTQPTTLTIMNLNYSTTRSNLFPLFLTEKNGAEAGKNWTVNLENINTGANNKRNLLGLEGGTVNISGTNNWVFNHGNKDKGMINASTVTITGTLAYSSDNANGSLVNSANDLTVTAKDAVIDSEISRQSLFVSQGTGEHTVKFERGKLRSKNNFKGIINVTSKASVEFFETVIEMPGNFLGFITGTKQAELTMEGATFDAKVLNGSFVEGTEVKLRLSNSYINITEDLKQPLVDVLKSNETVSQVDISDSTLKINAPKSTMNFFRFKGKSEVTISNSQMDLTSEGVIMEFTDGAGDSRLTINNGTKWKAYSEKNAVIKFKIKDNPFFLSVSGRDTLLKFDGKSILSEEDGGMISLYGLGIEVRVEDEATLDIESLALSKGASAFMMESQGGKFYVSKNATVKMIGHGITEGRDATLRFRYAGQMSFDVSDGGKVDIQSLGTRPAIRMYGGGNSISVSGGGETLKPMPKARPTQVMVEMGSPRQFFILMDQQPTALL